MSGGVAALDVLFLVAGAIVLWGAGRRIERATALLEAGLAFMIGFALATIVCLLLLVAGSDLSIPQFLAAFAAAALIVAALARRLGGRAALPPPRPHRQTRGRRLLTLVPAALLAVYLLALLRRTLYSGVEWVDAWTFWVPRAKTIYYFGGLTLGPNGFDAFPHAEYPPGVPGLNAVVFRFAGAADPLELPLQEWLVAVALVLALAALLAPRVSAYILSPALLFLAVTPSLGREIGILMADLVLAATFALAGACAVLWLLDRRPELAVLAGVFAASAAALKKEGAFYGVLLAGAIALVAPLAGLARRRALLLAVPPVVVSAVWSLWIRSHDVHTTNDYRLSDLLDPGFLGSRFGRLGVVLTSLPSYLFDPRQFFIALPAALAAAVLGWRRAPIVARLIVAIVPAAFVGLVVIYWISIQEVQFHLWTSAGRVPGPLVFLCLALLPLLVTATEERPRGP
jgi:hypothetical protein